jgi:hypothetical protein
MIMKQMLLRFHADQSGGAENVRAHNRPWGSLHDALVPLSVDGCSFSAGIAFDEAELARRACAGIGAVTSRGLLHALWSVPCEIPIPWSSLSPLDRFTLESEGKGWVDLKPRHVVRRYQPPGVVRTVSVSDGSLSRAISRVGARPPIFERIALWKRTSATIPRTRGATLDRARLLGIGVAVWDPSGVSELLAPQPAMIGVPSVYRWWQAELAYQSWLTIRRTQPTAQAAALAGSWSSSRP